MFRRKYFALAVILAAIVAVVGCSFGSNPSVHTESPIGATSASAGSIPIGVIGSYSGPEASYLVGADKTIEAWADMVNAAGGINGHKVQLFVLDDAGNTETSVQDARQLVQQDHVVAIVGEVSTGDGSWASYVQSQNIPVVGGDAPHPTFTSNADFYAIGANYVDGSYTVVAQTAAKGGGKSLGAVYCAELPVCAGVVQLFNTLGKQQHVAVNYQGKIAQGTPDFTAVCQAMKAAKSTYVYIGLAPALTKQIFNQCASEGIQLPLIAMTDSDSTFTSDPAFNGLVEIDPTFPFWQDNTPATEAFHAALAKYAPGVGTSASSPLTPILSMVWTSGKLFQAAVAAAGSGPVTAASIKKGLYALKNETLGGLAGPLNYKQGQPNLEHCSFVYKIADGKFVGLDGLKPLCSPPAITGPVAAAMSH
jgi:branched-chain amino acid transport system substrate-binding protein